jgi:hypothetical protein
LSHVSWKFGSAYNLCSGESEEVDTASGSLKSGSGFRRVFRIAPVLFFADRIKKNEPSLSSVNQKIETPATRLSLQLKYSWLLIVYLFQDEARARLWEAKLAEKPHVSNRRLNIVATAG